MDIRYALTQAVDAAAQRRLTGSFSERHPLLGRMRRCPYCRRRRYENAARCCTPSYVVLNDGVVPRSATAGRRKNSHTHKGGLPHPGPVNELHQRILEFQTDQKGLAAAVREMRFSNPLVTGPFGPTVPGEHIPVFAEKYVLWRERRRRKRKRLVQKAARRASR